MDPFPAGLAADGVDELVTGFGGRDPGSLCDAPGVLVIRAEDGARCADWTVVMGQPRAGVSRGQDPAAMAAASRASAAGATASRASAAGAPVAGVPAAGVPAAGVPAAGVPAAGAPAAGVTTPATGYCEVAGPAPVLYLMLWNRGTAAGLDVRGDDGVLAAWREKMQVRWD